MEMVKGGFDLDHQHVRPDRFRMTLARPWRSGPFGIRSAMSEKVYREVRDQIEQRVMRLVLSDALAQAAAIGGRCRSVRAELTLAGTLLDNRERFPPVMRMWRNWQTR